MCLRRIIDCRLYMASALCLVFLGCGNIDEVRAPETARPMPEAGSGLKGNWVGKVLETDAFIAIVADGEQLVGYACDQGTLAEWFFGQASGTDLSLANAKGTTLRVVLEDDAAEGTITFSAGDEFEFVVEASDETVLFRGEGLADGKRALAGWVVIGDEVRGAIDFGGVVQPAPPFDPNSPIELLPDSPILTMFPTPMAPDVMALPRSNTKFVWAALGESYAAGEGNPVAGIADPDDRDNFTGLSWGSGQYFVDQLNTKYPLPHSHPNGMPTVAASEKLNDLFTCHRSEQAGAPKANRTLEVAYPDIKFVLGHVACSGAEIHHLDREGYVGPLGLDDERKEGVLLPGLPYKRVHQPPQLARVASLQKREGQLDAIYMHIGGNDMGFGFYIVLCAVAELLLDPVLVYYSPGFGINCSQLLTGQDLSGKATEVEARFSTLKANMAEAWKVNPKTPVFLAQVPNPVHYGPDGICNGADYDAAGETGFGEYDEFIKTKISPEEAVFMNNLADNINTVFANAARNNKWHLVQSEWGRNNAKRFGCGMCDEPPCANLNSAAMYRQGRDLPVPLFPISAGIFHPNDLGYQAQAETIVDALRPTVDKKIAAFLTPPSNLRVMATTLNGNITITWNDTATTESHFDIEVYPESEESARTMVYPRGSTNLDRGGFRVRHQAIQGPVYVHETNRGLYSYRVRACNSGVRRAQVIQVAEWTYESPGELCGNFTPSITGANYVPDVPSGFERRIREIRQTGETLPRIELALTWKSQPEAIEYVVKTNVPGISTNPTEIRTSAASIKLTLPPIATVDVHVAACNRVGCSPYVLAY